MVTKPIETLVDWWLRVAIALLVSTYGLLTFNPLHPKIFTPCTFISHNHSTTSYWPDPSPIRLTQLDQKDMAYLEEVQKSLPTYIYTLQRGMASIEHRLIAVQATYNAVKNNLTHHAGDNMDTKVFNSRQEELIQEKNYLKNTVMEMGKELEVLESILSKAKRDFNSYKKCMKAEKLYLGEKDVPSPTNLTCSTPSGGKNETRSDDQPQGYSQAIYNLAMEIPSSVCGICTVLLILLVALRHQYHKSEKMLLIVYVLCKNIVIALLACIAIRCWLLEHNTPTLKAAMVLGVYLFFATMGPIYIPQLFLKIKKWKSGEGTT